MCLVPDEPPTASTIGRASWWFLWGALGVLLIVLAPA